MLNVYVLPNKSLLPAVLASVALRLVILKLVLLAKRRNKGIYKTYQFLLVYYYFPFL